jgi:FkbM family methyltransferase
MILEIEPAAEPTIDRQLYLYGDYERSVLNMMRRLLHVDDVVLDVGANIGLMTCHAARLAGHVIALEPSAATYTRLLHNIELNQLENVNALQVAAGREAGHLPMYYRPDVGSGGSTMRDLEREADELVTVARIDDLVSRPVSFMKIDVEGYELEALLGAPRVLASEPVVCMEHSRLVPGSTASESVALLIQSLDPSVYRLTRYGTFVETKGDYRDEEVLVFVPHSRLDYVTTRVPVASSAAMARRL